MNKRKLKRAWKYLGLIVVSVTLQTSLMSQDQGSSAKQYTIVSVNSKAKSLVIAEMDADGKPVAGTEVTIKTNARTKIAQMMMEDSKAVKFSVLKKDLGINCEFNPKTKIATQINILMGQ